MASHDPMPISSADMFLPQPSHGQDFALSANVPFFVRTLRQQDLFELADILVSSFHTQHGVMGWFYPVLRLGIYEDLRNRLHSKKPHYACLVAVLRESNELTGAEGRDRLIGTVEISLRNRSPNPFYSRRYPYLSNLAVLTDYRRQGVAQQLLRTSERVALDWGFRELYLHVLENNHRARRLYLKAGYQVQSVDINPVGWVFGRPRQLLLRKRLTHD